MYDFRLGLTLHAFEKQNCDYDRTPEDVVNDTILWKRMRDAVRAAAVERGLPVIRDNENHLIVEARDNDDIRKLVAAFDKEFCVGCCTTVEEMEDSEIYKLFEETIKHSVGKDPDGPHGASMVLPIYLV